MQDLKTYFKQFFEHLVPLVVRPENDKLMVLFMVHDMNGTNFDHPVPLPLDSRQFTWLSLPVVRALYVKHWPDVTPSNWIAQALTSRRKTFTKLYSAQPKTTITIGGSAGDKAQTAFGGSATALVGSPPPTPILSKASSDDCHIIAMKKSIDKNDISSKQKRAQRRRTYNHDNEHDGSDAPNLGDSLRVPWSTSRSFVRPFVDVNQNTYSAATTVAAAAAPSTSHPPPTDQSLFSSHVVVPPLWIVSVDASAAQDNNNNNTNENFYSGTPSSKHLQPHSASVHKFSINNINHSPRSSHY
jgi:hypothetical protein